MAQPAPKSKLSVAWPSSRRQAEDRRAGKVLREHLLDDSLLLPGLAGRRVFFNLGPIVDGGEPAPALSRAVRDVINKLPGWLAIMPWGKQPVNGSRSCWRRPSSAHGHWIMSAGQPGAASGARRATTSPAPPRTTRSAKMGRGEGEGS
jgi:hypothetical protein